MFTKLSNSFKQKQPLQPHMTFNEYSRIESKNVNEKEGGNEYTEEMKQIQDMMKSIKNMNLLGDQNEQTHHDLSTLIISP